MRKKAQSGIGTLIIFIAIILVAAIAAAVLLSTGETLQTKALETGKKSTEEVGTKLVIVSIVGHNTGSDDDIDELVITTRLSAGSEPVNLNYTLINYMTDNIYVDGINFTTATAMTLTTDYYSQELQGDGDSIVESGEVFALHFWITNGTNYMPLVTNEQFTISIIPRGGSVTNILTQAPNAINKVYESLFP